MCLSHALLPVSFCHSRGFAGSAEMLWGSTSLPSFHCMTFLGSLCETTSSLIPGSATLSLGDLIPLVTGLAEGGGSRDGSSTLGFPCPLLPSFL